MKITLPITVMAFETDFGGVVSNTRYVEYIERGRYALIHAAGMSIDDVWQVHGAQPIVRHLEIEYLGSARHEENLQLEVSVAEHTRSATILKYVLRREDEELMLATQTLAYITHRWRPTRVPDIFRDTFPVEE